VRDLRMLCLHGYHGTGAILRRQMAPLASAIPANIELVYVDAPSLSAGDFGWWHDGFSGWERTRDWAVELLCTAPRIDGIFGFSQGAALTGLLAALRDSQPSRLSFEFAIMVGGFTSTMPQHAGLLRHKLTVPSVHVIGCCGARTPAPSAAAAAPPSEPAPGREQRSDASAVQPMAGLPFRPGPVSPVRVVTVGFFSRLLVPRSVRRVLDPGR
jgi:hypothetical protein